MLLITIIIVINYDYCYYVLNVQQAGHDRTTMDIIARRNSSNIRFSTAFYRHELRLQGRSVFGAYIITLVLPATTAAGTRARSSRGAFNGSNPSAERRAVCNRGPVEGIILYLLAKTRVIWRHKRRRRLKTRQKHQSCSVHRVPQKISNFQTKNLNPRPKKTCSCARTPFLRFRKHLHFASITNPLVKLF